MPDLEIDEEVIPETPAMRFSRMSRQELLAEARARKLTGYASLSNPMLIDLLVTTDLQQIPPADDEDAPLVDGVDGDFEPEHDETPAAGDGVASTSAAGPSTKPPTGWQGALADRLDSQRAQAAAPPQAAPAPRDPFAGLTRPSARPKRARTGFDEASSTYREEFPIGARDVDDATHFDCIQSTHRVATEAGFRTRGAPWCGERVGYSKRQGVRTVIYQVSARIRED